MKRLIKPIWALGLVILSIVYLIVLLVMWFPITLQSVFSKAAHKLYFNTKDDSFVDWVRVGTPSTESKIISDYDLYVMVKEPESHLFLGRNDCYTFNRITGRERSGDLIVFVPKAIYHKVVQ